MPVYTLPGTEVGPRLARILGVGTLVLAVLIAAVWRLVPDSPAADRITIALVVGYVGEGIGPGTEIRLNGVRVGTVDAIDFSGPDRRRLGLNLQRSQLFGLTTGLNIDYVPGNLFGVSALELRPEAGGDALADGVTVDLTGRNSGRVRDATLSSLLSSTGDLTAQVLTPQLSQLLSTLARDFDAFTPLLQAIGTTVRAYTETRQLAPSMLLDRFGATLTGIPPMLTGTLTLLDASYGNGYLRDDAHIQKFARLWSNVQNQLLPATSQLFGTAQPYFAGLLPIATAVLDRIAGSVSDPAGSNGQLRELLDRIDAAFHDSPDGPVLQTRVALDLVPGLASPLAAGVNPTAGGGR
ncbi:MlaD family protein [Nocardia tengchongensis]|uniref:MlaD family protein n=1 Tax=Nocardia tengchongensis TaxID=2055889 RepID=UPI0036CA3303